MNIKSLILLLFLFSMIAISMFFASSPFSIVQNYLCVDTQINNQTVKVCGNAQRPDELNPVIELLAVENITSNIQPVNSLSVIQNGSMCTFKDEVKCLGNSVTNGRLEGKQYIVKQAYGSKTAPCDNPMNITFYYTDCTLNNGNVCIASRCVKYKYQVTFYQLMERLGFKP